MVLVLRSRLLVGACLLLLLCQWVECHPQDNDDDDAVNASTSPQCHNDENDSSRQGQCSQVDTNNNKENLQDTSHGQYHHPDDASPSSSARFFPPDCRLVMAPSTIPHAGWGVFVRGSSSSSSDGNKNTVDDDDNNTNRQALRQGQPLLWGDVVIHLTDLNQGATAVHDDAAALGALRRLLVDYAWDAAETGGVYEGPVRVVAVGPGVAMLANGLPQQRHNALPWVPTVDEGGQTRLQSPGAGAFTHYHNWTFFVRRPALPSGQEIFVAYGDAWFAERQANFAYNLTTTITDPSSTIRSDDELTAQGYCLDNTRPLTRSRIPYAGRGLQATRFLPEGAVVLPVPVLPLWKGRQVLQILRQKVGNDEWEVHWQLLRNYCYAHPKSNLWLFPYGPMVNLINHARSSSAGGGPNAYTLDSNHVPVEPNVRLQWSTTTTHNNSSDHTLSLDELLQRMATHAPKSTRTPMDDQHSSSPPPLRPPALLLELVALRDIQPGEELFMDYGPAWDQAWRTHVQQWKPPPGADTYAPAYVHDDAIQALRTAEELKEHPYPDNIFTSCFYIYNHTKHGSTTTATKDDPNHVVTVPWEHERGIFELRHLRPCMVLRRENSALTHQRKKEGTRFVVQIRNRPNLPPDAVIPPGRVHIVTRVPRHAIRFSDKIYTTDPHLPTAFRHEIHLPDNVFPKAWRDMETVDATSRTTTK